MFNPNIMIRNNKIKNIINIIIIFILIICILIFISDSDNSIMWVIINTIHVFNLKFSL